jgi:hypothetical protein
MMSLPRLSNISLNNLHTFPYNNITRNFCASFMQGFMKMVQVHREKKEIICAVKVATCKKFRY